MRLTQIVEALLFASDAPLSAPDIARVDERPGLREERARVGEHELAGDAAREITRQKDHETSNFVRFRHAAQWRRGDERRDVLVVERGCDVFGQRRSRRDRVDANTKRAKLHGHGRSQMIDGRLRRAVGREEGCRSRRLARADVDDDTTAAGSHSCGTWSRAAAVLHW